MPPAGYHPATTLMRFGEVTRRVLIACPRDFAALLKLLMSCYASKYRICNQGVVGSNPTAGTIEFNNLIRFFRFGGRRWLQMGYNSASLVPPLSRDRCTISPQGLVLENPMTERHAVERGELLHRVNGARLLGCGNFEKPNTGTEYTELQARAGDSSVLDEGSMDEQHQKDMEDNKHPPSDQ